MDSVQRSAPPAMVDRVFSQPQPEQLPPSHHSMLPPRQIGDPSIDTTSLH
jgi:hypothetical protein